MPSERQEVDQRAEDVAEVGGLLSGRRILLGSWDLFSSRAAGIGRYGRQLIRDLGPTAAELSVLWNCPRVGSPEVQEALLYRDPAQLSFSLIRTARTALKALFRPAKSQEFIPPGSVIPPPSGAGWRRCIDSVEILPNCYRLSFKLTQHFGRPLRVKTSRPVDLWHAIKPLAIRVHGAPFVVTMHDLVPVLLPYTSATDPREFLSRLNFASRYADAIVTVSDHTKEDLLRLSDIPEERIFTVHPAVSLSTEPMAERDVAARLRPMGLEPGGYILFCSTIEPRKNLIQLMEALSSLPDAPPLVICGREGWLSEETVQMIDLMEKEDRVIRPGYVSDVRLRALYAGALFLAFPSLYEGFGFPAAEAMAHGCPVLTSRVASLPEVCGEAALYVDPRDTEDIAEKLRMMIEDEGLRRELAARGNERVLKFSRAAFQRRIAEVYSSVMG
jgi:glycosyltransferase involved in cell wall biosynthesis